MLNRVLNDQYSGRCGYITVEPMELPDHISSPSYLSIDLCLQWGL